MNLDLNEVIETQEAMGNQVHSQAMLDCQSVHRHGVLAASRLELQELPMLSGGPNPTWHYCPHCFALFNRDGQVIEQADR